MMIRYDDLRFGMIAITKRDSEIRLRIRNTPLCTFIIRFA